MKRLPRFEFSDMLKHRMPLFGFSALWIVFFHMYFRFPANALWYPLRVIKNFGNAGVELFTLLSGMGLYLSMSKNPSVTGFYKRRLLRVYLPYALYVLIRCVVVLHAEGTFDPLELLLEVLALPWWFGAHNMWFVPFILTMYLVYPLLFRLQRRNNMYLLILFAISLALPFALNRFAPAAFKACELGYTRIPAFLLGCMLAPRVKRGASVSALWILPIIAAFAALRLPGTLICDRFSLTFLAAAVILIVVFAANFCEKFAFGRRVNGIFAFFGGISLEIYLIYSGLLNFMLNTNEMFSLGIRNIVLSLSAAVLTVPMAFGLSKLCALIIRKLKLR